ncbi:hypothetical protein B0T16DRAFT_392481 [Cercophora newfieldiana]|uniref:DUF7735 domain-containing protein n=1 Tax=Cercophora newfieldiana TaxID=92897 RepID=A0AA39Y3Y3_9PEZI|nr:hypothetical protein B0T16DRAFT_392481 [Cercophora newfieldiana]
MKSPGVITTISLLATAITATRNDTPQSAGGLEARQQSDLAAIVAAATTSCARTSITPYLDVPQPTGALHSALTSFAPELLVTCTAGPDASLYGKALCVYHPRERWCEFAREAPESLLPAWTSYLSSAAPWLEDRGSEEYYKTAGSATTSTAAGTGGWGL